MTQQLSRAERRRRRKEPVPPYDGPDAVAPPLRWARRFTPLGIGRRGVRLEMAGGQLSVVRVGPLGGERVVVQAPASQFHSLAPARSGRGLHLWHGFRLFRLVGRSSAESSGSNDVVASGDDVIGGLIALILFPVYLIGAIGAYTEKVASERANVATTLRWLEPVVGPPPPGLTVRPPLPGGWLTAGRLLVRLAVLGVGGVLALAL
ncbi:MAG TPA: hypothetical protein VHF92_00270 [Geodermatophilus sp.]|nr:hypothetical protein [Geodermatophilus sp.]